LDIKPGEKLLIKKIDRKVLLIPKPKEPVDFLIKVAEKVRLGNLRRR
jgi:hypothetical protein